MSRNSLSGADISISSWATNSLTAGDAIISSTCSKVGAVAKNSENSFSVLQPSKTNSALSSSPSANSKLLLNSLDVVYSFSATVEIAEKLLHYASFVSDTCATKDESFELGLDFSDGNDKSIEVAELSLANDELIELVDFSLAADELIEVQYSKSFSYFTSPFQLGPAFRNFSKISASNSFSNSVKNGGAAEDLRAVDVDV